MASPQPALHQSREPHIHVAGERCPVCEQPIPNEKAQEIRARTKARERELAEAANARATQQVAMLRVQIEAAAKAKIEQARNEGAEALRKAAAETLAKEAAARAAGKIEAEAGYKERLTTATQRETLLQEKCDAADREKQAAVAQAEALKAEHDKVVNERVQEVRAAMEKDKTEALGAEKAKHFEEKQKLTGKLEDLARQLEKKTADELGEGAEIDLLEALRAEFEGDRFEHVGKGNAGPDIIHTVMHNGRECGRIIYDSKNSAAWRNDYVSKLLRDQTATKAEHAVLCTLKFPAEARQIELRDGVIIVNPARALALVHILRKHVAVVHTLRLSKAEREKKMAALYDFITSERCVHLLARIGSHTESLLTLQEKEIKAHESHWKQEGLLLRSIQKVKAELETEIDCIIGTDDPAG